MVTRRTACAAAAAAVALAAFAAASGVVAHRADPDVAVGFVLLSLWLGAALGAIGALLLALRPGNLLGPLLLTAGAALAVEYLLREYAYRGRGASGAPWPFAPAAAWAGLVLDPLFFPATLLLLALLVPEGRLPRRGRRAWAALAVAVLGLTGLQVLGQALRPGPLTDPSYGYQVPWRGALPQATGLEVDAAIEAVTTVMLLLLPLCAGVLVARFARSQGVRRRQLAPLVVLLGLVVVALLLQQVPAAHDVGVALLVVGVAVGLPGALALGALGGMWDIDRLVISAIVYAVLATGVAVVYVTVVAAGAALVRGPAEAPPVVEVVTVVVLALVLGRARDGVTALARRLVYGPRASPYEALAALPHRLAATPAPDAVLPQVAGTLTAGLGVRAARVRAVLDDGTERTAWSGRPDADAAAPLVVVPVRHLGRVVGDVAVAPSPDRPLPAAERRLLDDLAAQAGPALHAVALSAQLREQLERITAQAEELRASRARVVGAQLAERRRIERDLHDGAQQSLTVLAARLAAVTEAAGHEAPATLAALETCRRDLDAAIAALRELARGVYPPVLSARGLAAALRAAVRSGAVPVAVLGADELAELRFAPEVELAVYFASLEALQNVAKHAPGAHAQLVLGYEGGELSVQVCDDGPGFDPAAAGDGTGLLGLHDRMAGVGGEVAVVSAPGAGTRVALTVRAVPV